MGQTDEMINGSERVVVSPDIKGQHEEIMITRDTATASTSKSSTKGINMCYLVCLLMTISIGTI